MKPAKAGEWRDYYLYKVGQALAALDFEKVKFFSRRLKVWNDYCIKYGDDW